MNYRNRAARIDPFALAGLAMMIVSAGFVLAVAYGFYQYLFVLR